jgi:hypothetical protein
MRKQTGVEYLSPDTTELYKKPQIVFIDFLGYIGSDRVYKI